MYNFSTRLYHLFVIKSMIHGQIRFIYVYFADLIEMGNRKIGYKYLNMFMILKCCMPLNLFSKELHELCYNNQPEQPLQPQ